LTLSFELNHPLAYETTLRIGGNADYFTRVSSQGDLVELVKQASDQEVPTTILGGGSNVLISDAGIKGLVVKNYTNGYEISGETKGKVFAKRPDPRWNGASIEDYSEEGSAQVSVDIKSGTSLQRAIYGLIDRGLTGLQWFSGIPGTIGGAVFNNIHGGTHFFSELVRSVTICDKYGNIKEISSDELNFDYDCSRFHSSHELILEASLDLFAGDKDRALLTADMWKKKKALQPKNSAGCTFKNIDNSDKERLGYPTCSAGYIIDKILKLTCYRRGDIMVSPEHANFIVPCGDKPLASDYIKVIREIQKRAFEATGLKLRPEIIFLGFNREEIEDIL
jgi:UDP-N-acetylmuramate dehydrogenase